MGARQLGGDGFSGVALPVGAGVACATAAERVAEPQRGRLPVRWRKLLFLNLRKRKVDLRAQCKVHHSLTPHTTRGGAGTPLVAHRSRGPQQ